MSGKFRLDRKIGFQNTFYTKCINVIIECIGPSIILRSTLIHNTNKCNLHQIWWQLDSHPFWYNKSTKLSSVLLV